MISDGWRTPLRIPKDSWKKFNPSELIRRSSLEGHGVKRKASDAELGNDSKKPRYAPNFHRWTSSPCGFGVKAFTCLLFTSPIVRGTTVHFRG